MTDITIYTFMMPIPSLHPELRAKPSCCGVSLIRPKHGSTGCVKANSQAAKQTAKTLLRKPLHWANNSASTAHRPWSSLTAAAKAVTALCLTSKKSSRKTSNTGFNLHKGRSTRPFFHVARHQLPSDGLDTDKYKKGRVQHVLFPFTLQVEFFNYFQVFIQFVHQRLTGWDFQAP